MSHFEESRSLRTSLKSVALAIALAGSASIALADAGFVTGSSSDVVALDATETSVDALLGQLASNYGFVVERSGGPAGENEKLSGHYEGSLSDVLARMLEDEDHLIRYAPGQPHRIAKIVLFGHSAQRPLTIVSTAAPAPAPVLAAPVSAQAAAAPVVPAPVVAAQAAPQVVAAIAVPAQVRGTAAKGGARMSSRSRRVTPVSN